jgi:type IV secretory pathway VirB10-like protein
MDAYGSTAPIVPARRSTWWIVPAVIVGLVVIAWLLLAGLPFGRDERVVTTETTETIAEGTVEAAAPMETGTVVDLGDTAEPPFATQTAPPPATQTQPPLTQTQPATQPPPVIVAEPPSTPAPRPAPPPTTTRAPQPPQEETPDEISESEASSTLRAHLGRANPYDGVSLGCLQIRSVGYRNAGYTFSVWDACVEGGGSRMLGRWRVDAKTREVFRQNEAGRYQ